MKPSLIGISRVFLATLAVSMATSTYSRYSFANADDHGFCELGKGEEQEGCDVVDAESYSEKLCKAILTNWSIPQTAQRGEKGAVSLRFYVGRDGTLSAVETLYKSAAPSLERAAQDAVMRTSPFSEPHFLDDKCERTPVTLNFFYNMGSRSRKRWLKQLPEVSKRE